MKILDVIKCEQDNALLVWKHPAEDFNTASTLIVHESQEAVFFKNGQVADVFPAGRICFKNGKHTCFKTHHESSDRWRKHISLRSLLCK